MPFYYPVYDPEERIINIQMIHEDTMTMVSFYTVSKNFHQGDLFSMFTTVPLELWISYVVSFFIFVIVSHVGSWLLRKHYSAFWNTLCAFLDQDNFPTDSLFIETLSFVMMLCSFFILSYATNSMGSDLVTVDKPYVVKSYDDIIDRNIKVMVHQELPEYNKFMHAMKGTMEYELSKNVRPNILGVPYDQGYYSQELVAIGRSPAVETTARLRVSKESFPNGMHVYVAPDERASKYTNVFVSSTKWRGKPVEKFAKRL